MAAPSAVASDAVGTLPPLVLLPGMQCTETTFVDVVAELTARAPSLRTLTLPVRADSTEGAVADLTDDLGRLRPDRPVVLVGHSLGACVAMSTVRSRPDLVAGLVCICANPRGPVAAQRDGWRDLRSRVEEMTASEWDALVETTLTLWHGDPGKVDEAVRERSRTMIIDTGRARFCDQLGVQLTRTDERPGLDRLDVPVLAIAGGRDAVVDVSATREIADRGRGDFVSLETGDHLAPLTAPAEIATTLLSWLRSRFAHDLPRSTPTHRTPSGERETP